MSKLWRDRHLGQRGDNTSSSRKTPSLLRLDSTGEVTSVRRFSGQTSDMCREKKGCCFTCKPRNLSLQSVVNGLNMSSVIDTANSYISSATTYLESICPQKTRKCLDDTSCTESNSIDLHPFFDNGCVMADVTKRVEGQWPNGVAKHNSNMGSQITQGFKRAWTQEILGALQSTVFSKDSSHLKSDRYIPPPIKHRLLQEQHSALFKDPKLTPYNAKLLEKSKRKDNFSNKATCQNMTKVHEPVEARQSEKCNEMDTIKKHPQSNTVKNDSQIQLSENSSVKKDLKSVEKDFETQAELTFSPSVPDWFEYENQDENIIPVGIDKELVKKVVENERESSADLKNDTQDRMLHSWYSMENDVDVKKSNSAQNIPLMSRSSHNLCKKKENPVNDTYTDTGVKFSASENSGQEATTNVIQESKHYNKDELDTKTDSAPKRQNESTDRKTPLISVLYIRNCAGQKCRPSAQKRSRHKAQKNCSKNSAKGAKSLKEGNSVHPNSSVAFILGLDHDQSNTCFSSQSFQVSCDIDDLDWSSCDEEDQFDDVDSCDKFDFFSPLNLMNFQVTCSVPSTQPTSYNHSLLDKINLEWEINISVKPEYDEKKPKKSKKVHFKDDEALATVHPMIAWSYAYQAARKGPWEEIARDRGRFQRRITDGEKLLKPILQSEHRNRIFTERFESDSDK